MDKTLHVHHLVYESYTDPWDYPEQLLITLCEICHEAEHNLQDASLEFVNVFRRWGFLNSDFVGFLPDHLGITKNQLEVILAFINEPDLAGELSALADKYKIIFRERARTEPVGDLPF